MKVPSQYTLHSIRHGQKQENVRKQKLVKMVLQKFIELAQKESAAPIYFAPEKDGSLRLCVAYRKLNALTLQDYFLIPPMDELVYFRGEAVALSPLDANSSYVQAEAGKTARNIPAFTSHHGLYQFGQMLFGLKNASGSFQRAKDAILIPMKRQFALVCLGDVDVLLHSLCGHINHAKQVPSVLRGGRVTSKEKKRKVAFHGNRSLPWPHYSSATPRDSGYYNSYHQKTEAADKHHRASLVS